MKISIVIPVHNAFSTLRRCVESFTVQNYPDLELILIENNSTDDSWRLCRELQKEFGSVVCMQSTETGVSAARNLGLRQASGEIIGFADADDAVKGDMLQLVNRTFLQNPECDAVMTGLEKIYPHKPPTVSCVSAKQKRTFQKVIRRVLCDRAVSGYPVNKFWRRDVVKGVFFREDLSHSEDTHFVMNVLSSKPQGIACLLPVSTYLYYQNDDSATGQLSRMFDEENRLKLIVAAQAILDDFRLTGYDRMLTKRLIFGMASSQYLRFKKQLKPAQSDYLKKQMRHCVWPYLITFYTAPLETAKRLLRLMGV